MTQAQKNRQQHRNRIGQYSQVYPCRRCGKSAGERYFSDRRTDTTVNGVEVGDFALCLCIPCATILDAMNDTEFVAEITSEGYGHRK